VRQVLHEDSDLLVPREGSPAVLPPDESLIVDKRASLSPAQMVEQKLRSLLRGKGLPVSHIQAANALRHRGQN
jgi:hypothetical protein